MNRSTTTGIVVEVFGKEALVLLSDNPLYIGGEEVFCSMRGNFLHDLKRTKQVLSVGDMVVVDQAHRICSLVARRNVLYSRPPRSYYRKAIAVNVQELFIVVAANAPQIPFYSIDRYLVAACSTKIKSYIVCNKVDCPGSEEVLEQIRSIYEPLGIPCCATSATENQGIDELVSKVTYCAFVGASGVGKTSLMNLLVNRQRKVRQVNRLQRGCHTTTTARLLPLKNGKGVCIDTPGRKSLHIDVQLDKETLRRSFDDIHQLGQDCLYSGCSHIHEPHCAVKEALREGKLVTSRYDSYGRILEEIETEEKSW